ncbi:hypothetical protein IL306_001855, partial [Fusarium sp. DS 682]
KPAQGISAQSFELFGENLGGPPYVLGDRCEYKGALRIMSETSTAAGNFSSHEYQLCYPYEGAAMDYSYEIDKKGRWFRTVGVTTAEEDEEDEVNSEGGTVTFLEDGNDVARLQYDVSRLAVDNLNKPHEQKSSEEILEELYRDPSWRLDKFFSCCVNNDICGVRRLISTFGDSFTESKDENGDNCVSLAAVEGYASMICFLHENGGDLNNVNIEEKTPLIEASL